ncbi:MAG: hypothetical protein LRY27_01190 [Chitinophagales bacterium]|nr:hypothetical protein [Chitinophagales bacterium]
MNTNIKNIIKLASIFILQILVFNNLNINGYINPYIYPLIIILLPFDIKGWILLLIAFFLGLTEDVFTNTLGMHTFSLVLMAGFIPFLSKLFSLEKVDKANYLNLKSHGLVLIISYLGLLFFIYNSSYFFLEAYNFKGFWQTIIRIFASTLISVILSILLLFFFNIANSNER